MQETLGRHGKAVDRCHLCREITVLQNSHILPEWGYESLYDETHRTILLKSGGLRPPSAHYMQKGVREPLLCGPCETRFSKHEKYARNLLMTPGRLALPNPRHGLKSRADYTPFKLFQLSLLWRVHLSTHDLFAAVNVGDRHAERLRMMLHTEDPGTASDYPCLLAVLYFNRRQTADLMLPVGYSRTEGQPTYRLIFAGFYWMFVVSSHSSRHPISQIALQPDGTFELHGFESRDSEGFRRYLANVMFPNQRNVERLRGKS